MKLLPAKAKRGVTALKKKLSTLSSAKQQRLQTRQAKRTLRAASPYQFAVADTLAGLNPELWDHATAQAGLFLSRTYLAALQNSLPENMQPAYALILQDNRVCAAVLMQVVSVELGNLRKNAEADANLAKKTLAAASKNLNRVQQKVLVCGNLLNYGFHGIAFAEGVDPAPVWHGVAELLYRLRRSHKLEGKTQFVLVKDILAPQLEQARQLELLNYRYVETEPNMVLSLNPDWTSHDDYAASMASKYRSSLRNQVFKPIEAAGCRVERLEDVAGQQERLHELYLQVQAKATVRPFELPARYFGNMALALGERLRCSVLRRGEEIIGFIITVADGTTAIAYHIGFDRAATEELPVYLRLLHAAIADAIAMGCHEVSFGRTALDPKASLGAKPVTFGMMVRHSQPLINGLIKGLLLGVEHDDAPERNPFKKVVEVG